MLLRRIMAFIAGAVLIAFFLPADAESAGGYDPAHPEYLEGSNLSCTSAILINADTGEVLFEKSPDTLCYPASTTKILTALLGLTMGENDQICTVSDDALAIPDDSSRIGLIAGEQLTLRDVIYATMIVSGNDGANVIAEAVSGTIPAFVDLMNRAASAFGCTSTHFANAHGYHDDNHYTTARDMAIIARTAMQNEEFRLVAGARSYTLPRDNMSSSRGLSSTNRLIVNSERNEGLFYEYATGVKTGQHSAAGYCLVGSASREGVSLISVVFNASTDGNRYRDTVKLLNYGFSQYVSTSIEEIYSMNPRIIEITGFDLDDPQLGKLELNLVKQDTKTPDLIVTTAEQMLSWVQNLNNLTHTEYTHAFRAPIEKGQVMGTLTYYPTEGNPLVFDLVASRSVAARERLAPTLDEIIEQAMNDPNPFPRVTFELVFLYILLPAAGILLLIRLFRLLRGKVRRKKKIKTINPQERYYR